ncbi:Adenylate cyclase, class 3 [Duganella sp. CF402]|nr:class 3 adenylate cyclase [Duganella sp. BK701]SEM54150.1 Adenylate cyclase, class 3 [Duganella sp. CF402]
MRRFIQRSLLFLALLWCCAASARVDLSRQAWVLEDPDGKLQIADILALKQAGKFVRQIPTPGYTTAAYWLYIEINTPESGVYWLDIANRTAQEIDAYASDATGRVLHMQTGTRFPFSHRPLPTDSFVFPASTTANIPTGVFIRIRSTGYHPIAMHLSLWQPDEYERHQQLEWIQWSVYLGMAFTLIMLNAMLWAYLRDANYLRYVFSLLSIAFSISTAGGGYGAAFRLLWPDSPQFEQVTWGASIVLALIFASNFIGKLINLPHHTPKIWRAIVWIIAVKVALACMYSLGGLPPLSISPTGLHYLYLLGTITYAPVLPLLLIASAIAARRGERAAYFVLVANFPIVLSTLLGNWQARVGQVISLSAMVWTSAFEILVMALALADKLHQEREQKIAAQEALVTALRKSEQELEQKVLQRTLELKQEQSKAKELLYNILPVELVKELETTGRAAPTRHESATVLFTDFSGFTAAAATMPADRMIAELNDIFAAFDDIADECGVEKIKTIGDAYMAAAGLPKPCEDHAQRCVRAGLRMLNYIEQRNQTSVFKWHLRVGIHSGPVVAGVVGKRKYAFDIWGDTVNIASRMESSGEAGRVNVSAYTSDLAREHFTCEYRGKVSAKGKGDIDMYFVLGERA